MSGYAWQSGMSNNAVRAYRTGMLPAGKLAKHLGKRGFRGVTTADIRAVLEPAEWHHTSSKFNRTEFFDRGDVWNSREELRARIKNRKRIALIARTQMPCGHQWSIDHPADETLIYCVVCGATRPKTEQEQAQ